MNKVKMIMALIIMLSLVGCIKPRSKVEYDSPEQETKERTEEGVGNGWYSFDETNENHQAVLKDYPYADLEEIPIIRFETDTTIAYGYEIKYADEVKRRKMMKYYGMYDIFQDRYIEFMEKSREILAKEYNSDFSTFKISNYSYSDRAGYLISFVNTTSPYNTSVTTYINYDIINGKLVLELSQYYSSYDKDTLLRKVVEDEIVDYGEWISKNTDGCEYNTSYGTTGLGFYVEERIYDYFKSLGLEHDDAVESEQKFYEIVEANKEKTGKEIKEILKNELGLDSYSWISFKPSCAIGGDSPIMPTEEEYISRKYLYKGLITYSDITIRAVDSNQYYAAFYYHPQEKVVNLEEEYPPAIHDKVMVAYDSISDHTSWTENARENFDKDPNWSYATIEDRMAD